MVCQSPTTGQHRAADGGGEGHTEPDAHLTEMEGGGMVCQSPLPASIGQPTAEGRDTRNLTHT